MECSCQATVELWEYLKCNECAHCLIAATLSHPANSMLDLAGYPDPQEPVQTASPLNPRNSWLFIHTRLTHPFGRIHFLLCKAALHHLSVPGHSCLRSCPMRQPLLYAPGWRTAAALLMQLQLWVESMQLRLQPAAAALSSSACTAP